MEGQVIQLFDNIGVFAVILSVALNILISVLGVVPSFFLTAANISFFGFGYGLVVSIIGEAIGAVISFYLYRLGIQKVKEKEKVSINNRFLIKLQQTEGITAFVLVFALRLAPFIPSGLITLISAGSRMGILNFSISSTLGKLPALLIEAYSVQAILLWNWQGKVILGNISLLIIFFLYRRKRKTR